MKLTSGTLIKHNTPTILRALLRYLVNWTPENYLLCLQTQELDGRLRHHTFPPPLIIPALAVYAPPRHLTLLHMTIRPPAQALPILIICLPKSMTIPMSLP